MKPSFYSDDERNQLTQYQILMQRRQHIERIFWSRIQILHLIQAGVLGGSFYLWSRCHLFLAPFLLSLGILLTIILFIICWYDWKDAQINDTRFHNLGDSLGIRRTAPRKCKIRTHVLLYIVIGLFITVDIAFLCFIILNS